MHFKYLFYNLRVTRIPPSTGSVSTGFLLENGSDLFLLEDGTSFLLTE